jgi:hypothetical protein
MKKRKIKKLRDTLEDLMQTVGNLKVYVGEHSEDIRKIRNGGNSMILRDMITKADTEFKNGLLSVRTQYDDYRKWSKGNFDKLLEAQKNNRISLTDLGHKLSDLIARVEALHDKVEIMAGEAHHHRTDFRAEQKLDFGGGHEFTDEVLEQRDKEYSGNPTIETEQWLRESRSKIMSGDDVEFVAADEARIKNKGDINDD